MTTAQTPEFVPAVRDDEVQPELTARAIALGCVLGIVFGVASTYLALKVGLTVSASVPIAVIAIALLRRRAGQRAILEHNITQTVGSAGESVAAAVVFTVPALIFLGYPLEVGLTTLIAATGGMLGVLLMVPLRRYLIVQEHGKLRYPEGKACAEILVAGEAGGTSARLVFVGMGIGALWKFMQAVLGAVKGSFGVPVGFYRGAEVACDFEPPLLGVGYIIGYRTSLIMVGGSLLASFILIPMIVLFGSGLTTPLPPATDLISAMAPGDVWKNYVRHIGAGAVAVGGIFAVLRAVPSIVSALSASAKALLGGGTAERTARRTDRDTPLPILVAGALALLVFLWLVPAFQMVLLGALLILVFGFLFGVVSSRVTGEVGSTSNPLSGMTIAVLMCTCAAFLMTGREGMEFARLALIVGAVVCIAISNAGTCSQDLKTGFLVGATPVRQQGALLIGVIASVLAVGWTLYLLNLTETKETRLEAPFTIAREIVERRGADASSIEDGKTYRFLRLEQNEVPAGLKAGNYLVDRDTATAVRHREDGIGSGRLRAPQATLMATVIQGLLTRRLPWDLILIGAAVALFIELLGFRSLTFAVGVYLPLAATLPVFLGGIVRKLADRRYGREPDAENEQEGTLYSSGVIAGASIMGILAVSLSLDLARFDRDAGLHPAVAFLRSVPGWLDAHLFVLASDLVGFGFLCVLGWLIYRAAAPGRR